MNERRGQERIQVSWYNLLNPLHSDGQSRCVLSDCNEFRCSFELVPRRYFVYAGRRFFPL